MLSWLSWLRPGCENPTQLRTRKSEWPLRDRLTVFLVPECKLVELLGREMAERGAELGERIRRECMEELRSELGEIHDQIGETTERLDLADALIRSKLGAPLAPVGQCAEAAPPRRLVDAARTVTPHGQDIELLVHNTPLILLIGPGGGDPDSIWEWLNEMEPKFRTETGPPTIAS
jgi:hypothetical protein